MDRLLTGALKVEVEPGIGGAAGAAAAKRGEGKADVGQVIDALVGAARPCEHHRVSPPPVDDAAKPLLLVVAGRTHEHQQIEPALCQARLQPREERYEEWLAILLVAGMRLHH